MNEADLKEAFSNLLTKADVNGFNSIIREEEERTRQYIALRMGELKKELQRMIDVQQAMIEKLDGRNAESRALRTKSSM